MNAIIFGGFDVPTCNYHALIKILKKHKYKVFMRKLDTALSYEKTINSMKSDITKHNPKIILAHSLSSPLLHNIISNNNKLCKNNKIAIFGSVQNLDNIRNIQIPDFCKKDICINASIFNTIGNFLNIFSQNENFLDSIKKQYNIGLLSNSLQHIRDNNKDYCNFLCDEKTFVVLSKSDKMVGYDITVVKKHMTNKIILKNASHTSLLYNKTVLSKFDRFIKN
jgi:hypothetical protein